MLFQINATLTEEDYLAFNVFHSFESAHGRKLILKSRLFLIAFMVFLMSVVIIVLGGTTFSVTYAILLGLFTILYMLLFRKILRRNIKVQIRRLKKIGKLPFDPFSTVAFYDDKILEITPSQRTERSYDALEKICLVKDRYLFLYYSSVGAYILPWEQVTAQTDPDDLLRFLSGKCSNIEKYDPSK